MTQDEWRRRREAQRLLNYHNARVAEQEQEVRAPNTETTEPRPRAGVDFGEFKIESVFVDEASELTPDVLRMFAKTMQEITERRLGVDFSEMLRGGPFVMGVDPAGEPEGRQISAREIRNRPHGRQYRALPAGGFRYIPDNANTAPPVQAVRDAQDIEAEKYKAGLCDGTCNHFDRWLDVIDSEEELENFLFKCWKFGKFFRSEGSETMADLEENGNPKG